MDRELEVFKQIRIEDKNRIESIRQRYGHCLSSHAFSSLYLWKDKMELSVYLTQELFCVRRGNSADNNYFFPCGSEKAKLEFFSSFLKKENLSLQYIQKEDMEFLEEYFPGAFEFVCAREDWEYIYDREEQVKLSGGSFKHLRTKVHKGSGTRNWSVVKLCRDSLKAAAEVTLRWNNEVKHNGESADKKATLNAFDNFELLDLSGVLLMENNLPYAFAMGSTITEDTFDLHISKTIESDIDAYLKWELYKQLPENIRYINREEDLGIEGLRIHKTDMKPVRFNELWKGRIRTQ